MVFCCNQKIVYFPRELKWVCHILQVFVHFVASSVDDISDYNGSRRHRPGGAGQLIRKHQSSKNLKQNFFLLKNHWPEIILDPDLWPDLWPEIIHDPLDRIQNTEENEKKSVKIHQCFGFGSERIWYFFRSRIRAS